MAGSNRRQNMFATPLLMTTIDDEAMRSDLEKTILARREAHPGIKRSNVGGWHSDLKIMEWGGDAARRLGKGVLALVNQNTGHVAAKEANIGWHLDGWANVNERGAINARHVHGGSFWSAVYYVRVDPGEGGDLVLHDPRMPVLAMHAPFLRFRKVGGEREVRFKPKAGELVIFPAWLAHEVAPWDGEGLRISIAMNLSAVVKRPGQGVEAALPTG